MIVELPVDVKEMLEPGEEVVWVGKPVRKPFVLKAALPLLLFTPFIIGPLILLAAAPQAFGGPIPLLFFLFWYGSLSFVALAPLYNLLVWKNVFYILTNRRVIVRKGLIGIDYDILDLENVQQVNVDVGFWDRLYGTGTIIIQSIGVTPVRLNNVEKPRLVQRILRDRVMKRRGG